MYQASRSNQVNKLQAKPQNKSGAMKIIAACAVSIAALAAFNAHAGGADVRWSVQIGVPAPPVVVYQQPQVVYQQPQVVYQQLPPVYYPAPVVYQQPQVVYQQPQVVYQQPAPVYYPAPRVVYPQPVVYGPGYYGQNGYWHHGHRKHHDHDARVVFNARSDW